jgi:hypothetical protein
MSIHSLSNTFSADPIVDKLAKCQSAEEKIKILVEERGILKEKNRSLERECDVLTEREKSFEKKCCDLEHRNKFLEEERNHRPSKWDEFPEKPIDIPSSDNLIKTNFDNSEKIMNIDLSKLSTVSDIDKVKIILDKNVFLISQVRDSTKQKKFMIEEKIIPSNGNSDKEIKEKTNKEKYEELQNRCKGNISFNFAEFFRNTEKITLTNMEFFEDNGIDIDEPQFHYYPNEERYSNALQYACENRLYDKMEISLRAGANPNFLIGKTLKCCPCTSPIDAVIYGNRDSSKAADFEKMEKQIKLLIRYGSLYEISEESAEIWRKIPQEGNTESEKFIRRFIDNSKIRVKNQYSDIQPGNILKR